MCGLPEGAGKEGKAEMRKALIIALAIAVIAAWRLLLQVIIMVLVFGMMAGVPVVLLIGLLRVPDNYVYTIMQWGRFHRLAESGWRWHIPALERVGYRIPLLPRYVDLSRCPMLSADGVVFPIEVTIAYRVDPRSLDRQIAAEVVTYDPEQWEKLIRVRSEETLRDTMAALSSERLSSREGRLTLKHSLQFELRDLLNPLGAYTDPRIGIVLRLEMPKGLGEAVENLKKAPFDARAEAIWLRELLEVVPPEHPEDFRHLITCRTLREMSRNGSLLLSSHDLLRWSPPGLITALEPMQPPGDGSTEGE